MYICQDHENGLTADEVIALTKEAKVFWTTVYLYCKLYSFYIFLFLFIFIFLMNKLCVHYKILSRCMIRPPERKFGRSLCFTSDVSIFLAVILTRQNNFYFLNTTILVFFCKLLILYHIVLHYYTHENTNYITKMLIWKNIHHHHSYHCRASVNNRLTFNALVLLFCSDFNDTDDGTSHTSRVTESTSSTR